MVQKDSKIFNLRSYKQKTELFGLCMLTMSRKLEKITVDLSR